MEFLESYSWVLFIAMIPIGFACWYYYEKKRSEEFKLIADNLGFSFSKSSAEYVKPEYKKFELFSVGRSKNIKNKIWKTDEFSDIAIFEYSYTTGSGKHSSTHRQTVVSIKSEELTAPDFGLKPESTLHRVGKLFGFQDIDFDSFPKFSKKYLLRGENVEKIREFFTPKLLKYFEENKSWYIEVRGGIFIFYKPSKIYSPEEIQGLYQKGQNILTNLVNRT